MLWGSGEQPGKKSVSHTDLYVIEQYHTAIIWNMMCEKPYLQSILFAMVDFISPPKSFRDL